MPKLTCTGFRKLFSPFHNDAECPGNECRSIRANERASLRSPTYRRDFRHYELQSLIQISAPLWPQAARGSLRAQAPREFFPGDQGYKACDRSFEYSGGQSWGPLSCHRRAVKFFCTCLENMGRCVLYSTKKIQKRSVNGCRFQVFGARRQCSTSDNMRSLHSTLTSIELAYTSHWWR